MADPGEAVPLFLDQTEGPEGPKKKFNMAQGSSAVHKTDSSSIHSICTPAAIADVSYFLHIRCLHASFVAQAVLTYACCVP